MEFSVWDSCSSVWESINPLRSVMSSQCDGAVLDGLHVTDGYNLRVCLHLFTSRYFTPRKILSSFIYLQNCICMSLAFVERLSGFVSIKWKSMRSMLFNYKRSSKYRLA